MAEAAGLVIGAVALASLFNSTVECFEWVHFARSFDRDFETSQLLWDDTKLRLYRWGAVVGISNIEEFERNLGSQERADQVKRRLKQIKRVFDELEETSQDYSSSQTSTELDVFDPDRDMTGKLASARKKLHKVFHKSGQKASSATKKSKWALRTKAEFNSLRADVNELVDGLEKLFEEKDYQLKARERVEWEVEEIHEIDDLSTLLEATTIGEGEKAVTQDPLLTAAIADAVEAREGKRVWKNNKVINQARARYGDEVASDYRGQIMQRDDVYDSNEASGTGTRAHYGTKYGGKGVLDD